MSHRAIRIPGYHRGKLPWKGVLAVCFFVFFLMGILLANWVGQEKLVQYGLLNEYYVNQLAYTDVDAGNYFRYLVRQRLPAFLAVCVLTFTQLGVPAYLCVVAWYAFSMGYLFVSALVSMGLKGMLLVLVSLFPQVLCYVLAYFCMAQSLFLKQSSPVQAVGKFLSVEKHKKLYLLLLGAACLLAGVWLEGYVNPLLVRGYLRRFG